jgi:hypothetical protein
VTRDGGTEAAISFGGTMERYDHALAMDEERAPMEPSLN